jgi:alkylated DNA repair dioxygenase AlkB
VLSRQLGLFSPRVPSFDASFARARRVELAHGAWIEHVPGWLSGHDALFDTLESTIAWRHERMHMYEREVAVPRLIAGAGDGPMAPVIDEMRRALDERYREQFVRVSYALYRDGRDSVAFHGDTTARDMLEATVATVSLGAPRRFLLKPTEGGPSIAFALGGGDLYVMGGTCQRTWRHGIPKVAEAGPRIAIMFRPSWEPATVAAQ